MKRKLINLMLLPISTVTVSSLFTTVSCGKQEEQIFYEKLMSLDNVAKVQIIKGVPDIKAKFIVSFKQPVNWKEPTGEMFEQRVEIGFKSLKAINCVYIRGYNLLDSTFYRNTNSEIVTHFDANYINIEYRYFSQSSPQKPVSPDYLHDPSYWEFLNTENASQDFNKIIESLKTILTGKWVVTGASKGGQATNALAMEYPHLADAYVAYVPPLPFYAENSDQGDKESKKMGEFCYSIDGKSGIGDDIQTIPKDKLFEEKSAVADIMWCVLQNQADEAFIPEMWKNFKLSGAILNDEFLNENTRQFLLYVSLSDYGLNVWQSPHWEDVTIEGETIPGVLSIANIARRGSLTAEEKKIIYNEVIGTSFDSMADSFFSYDVQAIKEMGLCSANFSLLYPFINHFSMAKPKIEDIKAKFEITEEQQKCFKTKMLFYDELTNKTTGLKYDKTLRENLYEYFTKDSGKNNDAHLIEIFGGIDPWRAFYRPIEDLYGSGTLANNVSMYVAWDQTHGDAEIHTLSDEDRNNAWSQLDSWLS